MSGGDQEVDTRPVRAWLGLSLEVPSGLHGRNRKTLVRRHTRASRAAGGRYFHQALARTYEETRERPLLYLLRPHSLDDALWRMVYAVMVKGGPVLLGSLTRNLALLTGPDRKAADEVAMRLWGLWQYEHRRAKGEALADEEAERLVQQEATLDASGSEPEEMPAVMGRPPKPDGDHHVPIKISLPPDLAELLKADPEGASKAIARMMRERRE